jgi:hypothetical protein
MQHFMKNRPVKAEFFQVDRRTHMTNLLIAFRNFANASKTRSQVGELGPCGLVFVATRLRTGQAGERIPTGGDIDISKI